jgi:dsRNA-specific ribonuclease
LSEWRTGKKIVKEYLLDKNTSFNQKTENFIKIFNAGSTDPNSSSEKWQISNDEWQRYKFLGDRVLNLVVAVYLYRLAPADRKGVLTQRRGGYLKGPGSHYQRLIRIRERQP